MLYDLHLSLALRRRLRLRRRSLLQYCWYRDELIWWFWFDSLGLSRNCIIGRVNLCRNAIKPQQLRGRGPESLLEMQSPVRATPGNIQETNLWSGYHPYLPGSPESYLNSGSFREGVSQNTSIMLMLTREVRSSSPQPSKKDNYINTKNWERTLERTGKWGSPTTTGIFETREPNCVSRWLAGTHNGQ